MKVLGAVSLVCFFRRRRKTQGARRREAVAVAVAVLIGYADCFEDRIALCETVCDVCAEKLKGGIGVFRATNIFSTRDEVDRAGHLFPPGYLILFLIQKKNS